MEYLDKITTQIWNFHKSRSGDEEQFIEEADFKINNQEIENISKKILNLPDDFLKNNGDSNNNKNFIKELEIFRTNDDSNDTFFSKIDIFCITSKTESFNISLIESMAHKVCVISSKCGGPEDIIDHDINGVLYANNSIKELSEKLYMLIRHQEKREKLALAGFDKVCKNFAMPIIEKKLQMIVLRVL